MRRAGLWAKPDFLKLWGGQAVSHMGSSVTDVALPLTAAALLHATPLQMGLLSGAGAGVVLLGGLFAGVWADRVRRRPLLVFADFARAAILGTIPLAAAFAGVTMGHLYLVAAAVSLLTAVFEVSYQAWLPSLVERENLVESNAKLGLATSVADVTGPGLAGALIQWLTAPKAILVDALSFLVSAASILAIRKPEPPPPTAANPHVARELADGLRACRAHPVLRALALRTATGSLFLGFASALYILFAVRELGLSAGLLGAIISIGGASNLAGGFAAPRLVRRYGLGPTIVGAALVTGVTMLVPVLARGPVPLSAAILALGQLFDLAWPVYFINEITLRQAVTPDHLLGRVNAAMHMLFRGLLPLGALAGGAIAEAAGMRATLLLGAAGYLLSTLWLVFSPIRELRELPALQGVL